MIETKNKVSHPTAVIRVSYGNQGIAEFTDGQQVECVYRRSVGRPYTGDRVELETVNETTHAVASILPRRNLFVRADRQQRKQVVASNLDLVAIVIAPRPAPSTDLVERYLVAVHSLGIAPLLVVNKVELLSPNNRVETPPFSRIETYRALGYPVVEVSCKGAPGVDRLLPELSGRTSILVGQSGVGKSSLANQLIPDLDLQTGALSNSTGKGIHTTTTTIMYSIPGGGSLLDSPGVWEYGLWKLQADELAAGFPEFSEFLGKCRFNNCQHHGEPACAIESAVETGQIFAWRYQSYRRLLTQNV